MIKEDYLSRLRHNLEELRNNGDLTTVEHLSQTQQTLEAEETSPRPALLPRWAFKKGKRVYHWMVREEDK